MDIHFSSRSVHQIKKITNYFNQFLIIIIIQTYSIQKEKFKKNWTPPLPSLKNLRTIFHFKKKTDNSNSSRGNKKKKKSKMEKHQRCRTRSLIDRPSRRCHFRRPSPSVSFPPDRKWSRYPRGVRLVFIQLD